jgi:lysylphosphatidylglycerol synthetase-like protein (DUF2156 family)
MLLLVFGLAVTAVAAIFVRKTARENGRKAGWWTLVTVGLGVGLQIVLPFMLGIVLVLIFIASGTRNGPALTQKVETPAFYIDIISLIASLVAMFFVLRHVAKLPEDVDLNIPPPPFFGDQIAPDESRR